MAKIRRKTFIVGIDTDKKDFTSWMKQQLKESRNRAIDDYANKIKEMYALTIYDEEQLDKIAKELKEGAGSDN